MRIAKIMSTFCIVGSCIFMTNVSATCDYETTVKLATEAANVKATSEADWYGTGEFVEAEVPDENGNFSIELYDPKVTVNIYNITDNIYITLKNKMTNEINTYYYQDTDNGGITFERTDLDHIVEYEIKVYSNNSNCMSEELLTIPLVTPKYNDYHNHYYCENSTKYYCQEFVTTEITLTEQEIYQEYEKNKTEENPKDEEEQKSFWETYQKWIIGGTVIGLVIIGVATTAIVIKRKRSRVI